MSAFRKMTAFLLTAAMLLGLAAWGRGSERRECGGFFLFVLFLLCGGNVKELIRDKI